MSFLQLIGRGLPSLGRGHRGNWRLYPTWGLIWSIYSIWEISVYERFLVSFWFDRIFYLSWMDFLKQDFRDFLNRCLNIFPDISCTLQHIQFATHALCNNCTLQYVQFLTHAIYGNTKSCIAIEGLKLILTLLPTGSLTNDYSRGSMTAIIDQGFM